jgi:hypothetical protein
MSEKVLFQLFMNDKTITNPLNKTEIFFCSDLYKDYKKCKALYRKGLKTKAFCRDIRYLGQKCYMYDEEDFEKHLVKLFEEKKKYITYLKDEGSILFEYYRNDPTVFSLKHIEDEDGTEGEFNEFLINQK